MPWYIQLNFHFILLSIIQFCLQEDLNLPISVVHGTLSKMMQSNHTYNNKCAK